MAPKISRKRPASALASAQTEQIEEEEAPTISPNVLGCHASETPADPTLPEATLHYQMQHGLVMRDGRLGPVCIRGATTVVDNGCKNGIAIVTGGDDGSIRVWDDETGELQRSLRCANDSIDARLLSLSKFPSGRRILTTHHDGTACVIEAGSGKQVAKFGEPGGPAVLSGVTYADEERVVTINAAGDFRFWSLAAGWVNAPIAGGSNAATTIAMFPGDRNIAVGMSSGKVDIWCCRTGKCTKQIHAASSPITLLVVFPDGTKVLTASENENYVSIWGVEDVQLSGFGSRVVSAAVSQCGTFVATGEAKGFVKIWNAKSGSLLSCWSASTPHQNAVHTCTFLDKNRVLATGEWGGTVWELPEVACSAADTPEPIVSPSVAMVKSAAMHEDKEIGTGLRVSFSLSPMGS